MAHTYIKELEKHELISRKAYAAVPPKVEYTITEKGKKVIPVIEVIRNYGLAIMEDNGLAKVERPMKKIAAKRKTKASK